MSTRALAATPFDGGLWHHVIQHQTTWLSRIVTGPKGRAKTKDAFLIDVSCGVTAIKLEVLTSVDEIREVTFEVPTSPPRLNVRSTTLPKLDFTAAFLQFDFKTYFPQFKGGVGCLGSIHM